MEEFKVNGQYVNTPVVDGKPGVVGIPFFDMTADEWKSEREVAEALLFMLTRPRGVVIRDMVILPNSVDL